MLETILSNILTAVIIMIITMLGTLCSRWLLSVLKSHNVKVSEDTITFMMDSLTSAITKAVIATNQTYVNDLKKSGKFTSDAKKEAMAKSVEYCKSLMASNVLDFFENNYSDLDSLLTTLIESYIGSTKNSKDLKDALDFMSDYLKNASKQQGFTTQEIINELREKLNLPKSE